MNILRYCLIGLTFLVWISCNSNGGEETEEVSPDHPLTQLEQDVNAIKKYLKKNDLEAEKTPSGIFYSVQEKGSGGQVEEGKTVKFHTTGKLLDGTVFYSSHDEGQPLEAIIGRKMLVDGVEEGLKYFKAGGKGTLYVPSPLGYGEQGFEKKIPPNSIIIFEVEVLSVE